MSDKVFVRFERGRDEVTGPTFGPFEWFQQTYQDLRVSPDGDPLAEWNEKAGEWFIIKGEHEGEFYSDFIVYSSDKAEIDDDHDCAAGKVTTTVVGGKELEQKWNHEEGKWVLTGRVWDQVTGKWKGTNLKKFTVVGVSDGNLRFADHVKAVCAQAAEEKVLHESKHSAYNPVIAGVFEGFLDAKDEQ